MVLSLVSQKFPKGKRKYKKNLQNVLFIYLIKQAQVVVWCNDARAYAYAAAAAAGAVGGRRGYVIRRRSVKGHLQEESQ